MISLSLRTIDGAATCRGIASAAQRPPSCAGHLTHEHHLEVVTVRPSRWVAALRVAVIQLRVEGFEAAQGPTPVHGPPRALPPWSRLLLVPHVRFFHHCNFREGHRLLRLDPRVLRLVHVGKLTPVPTEHGCSSD